MEMAKRADELFVEQWAHDTFDGTGAFREQIRQRLIICGLNPGNVSLALKQIFDWGFYFSHYFDVSSLGKTNLAHFLKALEVIFVYNTPTETLIKGCGLFENAFWALEKSDQILLWRYNLSFDRAKISVADMQDILDKTMEISPNVAAIFKEFKVELGKIETTISSKRKLRYHKALDALHDNIEQRLDLGGLQR